MMKTRKCELCNADATVFCPSDSAFLCTTCDTRVHDANFLVARHLRRPLINSNAHTSCVSTTTDSSSSSSSSSSSTAVLMSRRRLNHLKAAEGVSVSWCAKLGVESGSAVATGRRALKLCGAAVLPFRVCLAASMWVGLRLKSAKVLKRLEEISGVPAKVILAAESKLGRAGRRRRRRRQGEGEGVQLQEGWAEC